MKNIHTYLVPVVAEYIVLLPYEPKSSVVPILPSSSSHYWYAYTKPCEKVITLLFLLLISKNLNNTAKSFSEMIPNSKPNVIVIGSGLAGLGISLGLSKTGKFNIHLVEKQKEFFLRGATFGLAPNGIKALEELCPEVAEDVRETASPFMDSEEWTTYALAWWEMRNALLNRVRERNDTIKLHMGLEIDSIEDIENAPFAKVRFKNSSLELEAQLVIGADGVNSAVRSILGHKSAVKSGACGWRGSLDLSKPGSKLAHLLDKGYVPFSVNEKDLVLLSFNFHPRSSRLAWVLASQLEQAQDIKSATDVIQLFKEKVDEDTWDAMTNLLNETDPETLMSFRVKSHDMSDDALKLLGGGWGGRGRVTLIGDAAHAMRASTGQGGSMAFEDCAVLCRILSQDDISQSLLTRSLCEKNIVLPFEQERIPRVKIIHEDTRLRALQTFEGKRPGPWDPSFASWVYTGA